HFEILILIPFFTFDRVNARRILRSTALRRLAPGASSCCIRLRKRSGIALLALSRTAIVNATMSMDREVKPSSTIGRGPVRDKMDQSSTDTTEPTDTTAAALPPRATMHDVAALAGVS